MFKFGALYYGQLRRQPEVRCGEGRCPELQARQRDDGKQLGHRVPKTCLCR